jgi:NADPH-dependent ferric siderophore reductase
MTRLVARARTALAAPEAVIGLLCKHLVEHDATIDHDGGATLIAFGANRACIEIGAGHLIVEAEAPDLARLQEVKRAIASHVVEFAPAGQAPVIVWTGDGAGVSTPPDFRLLTVLSVHDVTPHMRRISFQGEDLARFDTLDALHVRLFLPPPGVSEPAWPLLGEDGLIRQPPPESRPVVRKYTIREIDVALGTVSIDFVLHDDAGPGAAFAAGARAGDRIGMAGPGGRGLRQADWYVLMGDETALPAIGRMLAHLPQAARGMAIVEVANADEIQELAVPAGMEIRWLFREGAAPGTTRLLEEAFETIAWPQGPATTTYLWAAMEHSAFRAVRAAARQRLRLELDQHLVVYWRRGVDEDRHVREKAAERVA